MDDVGTGGRRSTGGLIIGGWSPAQLTLQMQARLCLNSFQLFYLETSSGLKIWYREGAMDKSTTAASWLLLSSAINSAIFLVLLPFKLWCLYRRSTKVRPSWHGKIKFVRDYKGIRLLSERF